MDLVSTASRIARSLHVGQLDKQGQPYEHHLQRVASYVDGDTAKATAWLHDAFEDTPVLVFTLLSAGIPVEVITAMTILTRPIGITYAEYIRRVVSSGNATAIAVKRADLQDNLRPGGPEQLVPRYRDALAQLSFTDRQRMVEEIRSGL
jgi:(p)ppGpp synthase/HD superfamily hydrolase